MRERSMWKQPWSALMREHSMWKRKRSMWKQPWSAQLRKQAMWKPRSPAQLRRSGSRHRPWHSMFRPPGRRWFRRFRWLRGQLCRRLRSQPPLRRRATQLPVRCRRRHCRSDRQSPHSAYDRRHIGARNTHLLRPTGPRPRRPPTIFHHPTRVVAQLRGLWAQFLPPWARKLPNSLSCGG